MKSTMHKGQLTTWNDDRGFGFIQPHTGGPQVFIHISVLNHTRRRPQTGDIVRYEVTTDGAGKLRAANAAIEGVSSGNIVRSLVLVVQFVGLALLPVLGAMHMAATIKVPIPLFLYPVMSIVTFWLYAEDKVWAKTQQSRIPEVVLHSCELLGGWLGAFVAQRTLRHKSIKRSYQVTFWTIVALHLVFWVAWFVVMGVRMN